QLKQQQKKFTTKHKRVSSQAEFQKDEIISLLNEFYDMLSIKKDQTELEIRDMIYNLLKAFKARQQQHQQQYLYYQNAYRQLDNNFQNIKRQYDYCREALFEVFSKYKMSIQITHQTNDKAMDEVMTLINAVEYTISQQLLFYNTCLC